MKQLYRVIKNVVATDDFINRIKKCDLYEAEENTKNYISNWLEHGYWRWSMKYGLRIRLKVIIHEIPTLLGTFFAVLFIPLWIILIMYRLLLIFKWPYDRLVLHLQMIALKKALLKIKKSTEVKKYE